MTGCKKWCFTLNNPTNGESSSLVDVFESEHVKYAVVGRETGESGTPHLQGFVWFTDRKSLRQAKAILSDRMHLEPTQGTDKQASDYCKKEGDYDEYGELPSVGTKCQWERYQTWLLARTIPPSETEICLEFPSLYGRYRVAALQMSRLLCPIPLHVEGDLRPWQQDLEAILLDDPDDRTVHFRIDETKKYYFFDCPRGSLEHFQYSILEQLKDRVVFSPKYDSTTKLLHHKAHVVCFTNEFPDMDALSADRYDVIEL